MTGDEALAALDRVDKFILGLRVVALTTDDNKVTEVLDAVADNLDKVIKGQQP